MRLTQAEVEELPLPAALVDSSGNQIGRTPEWRCGGIGTVQYRLGPYQLFVETEASRPAVALLSARLLDEMDAAVAGATGHTHTRRSLLRAGLRLVAGQPDMTPGTTDDVIAALSTVSDDINITVEVDEHISSPVAGAATVALALKQIATNAWKHDGASELRCSVGTGPTFRLTWSGSGDGGIVETSRHPELRTRWGLAMVRMAADALGASVLPVRRRGDGLTEGVFAIERGAHGFSLPVAAIADDGHTVLRATRAWDEETSVTPGRTVNGNLHDLAIRAMEAGGKVVATDPYNARRGRVCTWIAQRPRAVMEQALDLVTGLSHERSLSGNDDHTLRLRGCASALALAAGLGVDLVRRDDFDAELAGACSAYGAKIPQIESTCRVIPPAPLAAFLSHHACGGVLSQVGGSWIFLPTSRNSAVINSLTTGGAVALPAGTPRQRMS
jgi:hypothetical protein